MEVPSAFLELGAWSMEFLLKRPASRNLKNVDLTASGKVSRRVLYPASREPMRYCLPKFSTLMMTSFDIFLTGLKGFTGWRFFSQFLDKAEKIQSIYRWKIDNV